MLSELYYADKYSFWKWVFAIAADVGGTVGRASLRAEMRPSQPLEIIYLDTHPGRPGRRHKWELGAVARLYCEG